LTFVVSLFGCPLALDARGCRIVRPPPLHATAGAPLRMAVASKRYFDT